MRPHVNTMGDSRQSHGSPSAIASPACSVLASFCKLVSQSKDKENTLYP